MQFQATTLFYESKNVPCVPKIDIALFLEHRPDENITQLQTETFVSIDPRKENIFLQMECN